MSSIMALSTYFIHAFLNNYLDTDKAAVPIWGICAMWLVYEAELGPSTADPKWRIQSNRVHPDYLMHLKVANRNAAVI